MREQISLVFDKIKKAVSDIAQINCYNPLKDTRVKCDASLNGFEATLEQKTGGGDWMPIAFALRYLEAQKKIYSTNELELLAVVWAVE